MTRYANIKLVECNAGIACATSLTKYYVHLFKTLFGLIQSILNREETYKFRFSHVKERPLFQFNVYLTNSVFCMRKGHYEWPFVLL